MAIRVNSIEIAMKLDHLAVFIVVQADVVARQAMNQLILPITKPHLKCWLNDADFVSVKMPPPWFQLVKVAPCTLGSISICQTFAFAIATHFAIDAKRMALDKLEFVENSPVKLIINAQDDFQGAIK